MSMCEFRKAVSCSGFLFDWQKERLLAMLDGENAGEGGGNGSLHIDDVMPVLDNVLWRTTGVGLDSLPAMDRMRIVSAAREMVY